MDSITIEESTFDRIPPRLQMLIESFSDDKNIPVECRRNDLFISLLYVLMLECGFKQADKSADGLQPDLTPSNETLQNWRTRRGMYVIKFTFKDVQDCTANLMVNPMGSTMLINIMLPSLYAVTYSVCMPISRYVVSPFASKPALIFRELPELSMKFKGSIAQPARCAILASLGLVNGSLTGIPDDVLVNIFSMLGACDLCSLAQTCVRLRDFSGNNVLWRKLFMRDFPNSSANSPHDWNNNYKSAFTKKKLEARPQNLNTNMHHFMDYADHIGYIDNSGWDLFSNRQLI